MLIEIHYILRTKIHARVHVWERGCSCWGSGALAVVHDGGMAVVYLHDVIW